MSVSLTRRIPGLRRRSRPSPPSQDPAPPAGFEYGKAPSVRAAKVTRVGFRIVLGLVLILLVVNVVQNARAANRAATTSAPAGISADGARAIAGTFAGDYLSHDPAAAPLAGQPALQGELATGGDPARMAFAGTAWMSADVVLPGAVTQLDATHALVTVQARVTLGMPGNADAVPPPATTAAPTVPGRAANRAALPAAYQVVATEWLSLAVPVIQTDSGVLVDPSGPVFSADSAPATTTAGLETDSTATEATRSWAKTLFTSYAAGSTQGAYLSAPGVNLTGLSGAVTVTDVSTWSLSAPGPDGIRTGQARVSWTFAPTADLTTSQSYVVMVQSSDNRWYVTTLGAFTTPTSSTD